MINSPHKRFYSKGGDKKLIAKFNISSGMIVEFPYKSKSNERSKPLVFVMDTDEYGSPHKKSFSGINLNYLPHREIEKFFVKVLSKAGWELDKFSKFPKVDLWEEENPGVKPIVIYKSFLKKAFLNRFDCWRTYKYMGMNTVQHIKFNFKTYPLSEVYDNVDKIIDSKKSLVTEENRQLMDKISKTKMYNLLKNIDNEKDED